MVKITKLKSLVLLLLVILNTSQQLINLRKHKDLPLCPLEGANTPVIILRII